jgi:hypothetical protein
MLPIKRGDHDPVLARVRRGKYNNTGDFAPGVRSNRIRDATVLSFQDDTQVSRVTSPAIPSNFDVPFTSRKWHGPLRVAIIRTTEKNGKQSNHDTSGKTSAITPYESHSPPTVVHAR